MADDVSAMRLAGPRGKGRVGALSTFPVTYPVEYAGHAPRAVRVYRNVLDGSVGLVDDHVDPAVEQLRVSVATSGAVTARQLEAAAWALQSALSGQPDSIACWVDLGVCLLELGDVWAARRAFAAGVAAGEMSLPADFDEPLPWGTPGNRPFLRALDGLVVCRWACQDRVGALAAASALDVVAGDVFPTARYIEELCRGCMFDDVFEPITPAR